MNAQQLQLPLRFLSLVECSQNANHHLRRWRNRPYEIRVTIFTNPKFVGQRVCKSLGTKDVREARRRRDAILSDLKKAGLLSPESKSRLR